MNRPACWGKAPRPAGAGCWPVPPDTLRSADRLVHSPHALGRHEGARQVEGHGPPNPRGRPDRTGRQLRRCAAVGADEQFHVDAVSAAYWRVNFDNGPVNLLDPDTVEQLGALIKRIEKDPDLTVVGAKARLLHGPLGFPLRHRPCAGDVTRPDRAAPVPGQLPTAQQISHRQEKAHAEPPPSPRRAGHAVRGCCGVRLARFSGRERRRGAMRDLVELIADASWICDAPRRRPAASPGEAGLIESSWGVVRPRGLLLG